MELDHLAVTAADLATGAAWTEDALGVTLLQGGQHARYGTHNRLLGLDAGLYLEVIAPDPTAPTRPHPRWFGLDQAGAPTLGNWICRSPNLAADLEDEPKGTGDPVPLKRGDLAWTIAVPADGSLPMQGGYPTLIQWTAGAHPSTRLPDSGLRLTRVEVHHPQAAHIAAMLADKLTDPRVQFIQGDQSKLRAAFSTPSGERWLG